MLVKGDS
jgi:hypothetical protein